VFLGISQQTINTAPKHEMQGLNISNTSCVAAGTAIHNCNCLRRLLAQLNPGSARGALAQLQLARTLLAQQQHPFSKERSFVLRPTQDVPRAVAMVAALLCYSHVLLPLHVRDILAETHLQDNAGKKMTAHSPAPTQLQLSCSGSAAFLVLPTTRNPAQHPMQRSALHKACLSAGACAH
jgi:hypothetical protein